MCVCVKLCICGLNVTDCVEGIASVNAKTLACIICSSASRIVFMPLNGNNCV